ncbi:squalene synthetase-like protein [Coemansia erecta]|nr:squalene synthetase-like protein [Coemansia sp. RSA 2618]KAJ2824100.1 squalene synthetase-like protein [Coemansia erecta]
MDDLFFIDTKGSTSKPAKAATFVHEETYAISDDLADDYLENLSEDGLEYLLGAGAATPFLSRDLGGHASSHGNHAPDTPANPDSLPSDDLEVDDPFKYEDRLAELVLGGSDSDELDDDGFPCNMDMVELNRSKRNTRPKQRRKGYMQQAENTQSFKDHDQAKGKNSRSRQKKKSAKQNDHSGPSPGFDPRTVLRRLDTLIYSNELDSMWLQPMNKFERQIVHIFAREYKVKSKSQGSGVQRMPILTPTSSSCRPKNRRRINRLLMLFDEGGLVPEQWTGEQQTGTSAQKGRGRNKGKNKNGKEKAAHDTGASDGKMVAENAPEVGASNIGHKMLQQMGWTPGQGLGGDEKGRAQPVDVMIRTGRRGLGT